MLPTWYGTLNQIISIRIVVITYTYISGEIILKKNLSNDSGIFLDLDCFLRKLRKLTIESWKKFREIALFLFKKKFLIPFSQTFIIKQFIMISLHFLIEDLFVFAF